jgi:Rrf2 family protein
MFNLSKKTEYGLQALTYLSNLEDNRWANVTEIARSARIPKELLAKILSELVKAGLARSFSGPTGGFRAAKDPSQVSLADILTALENKNGLIACDSGNGDCKQIHHCTIRKPLARVNQKVKRILEETMLADLLIS